MLRARIALVAAVLAASPSIGAAGTLEPLRVDLKVDVPVTASAGALWAVSELLKSELAPADCRFCDPNTLDRQARERLVWTNAALARHGSDLFAFGLVPVAVVGRELVAGQRRGDLREGFVDVLVIFEAAAIAGDLNQLTKFAVGRQRPFARFGNYADPNREPEPDDNLSFYSGHSSLAFSLAAAAGTVASLRHDPQAPWVWGVGMTLATTVAYLRVAGDMHYLTDVLTGAAVGTAVGVGVPLLHRPRSGQRSGAVAQGEVAVFPTLGGLVVVF